jgi:transcriptional activator of cad operon
METGAHTLLRVGDWCVDPASGQISRKEETARLETRAMRLLLCLAGRQGQVVSIDDLLAQVWTGVTVSPDSVYQAVTSLRRQLGDDPKQPTYIETVPRLGYRMVASVGPWTEGAGGEAAPEPLLKSGLIWAAVSLVSISALVLFFFRGPIARHLRGTAASQAPVVAPVKTENSIAVLPFLDLTEGMHEEEFADGMTEELIDKLTKIPGLHVAPTTSSFYYKGKQVAVAEVAKELGVVYVLDGSVRKSENMVRVAARLTKADTGFVVWSETYDRPSGDLLMVQDDIATEVAKALRVSITSH